MSEAISFIIRRASWLPVAVLDCGALAAPTRGSESLELLPERWAGLVLKGKGVASGSGGFLSVSAEGGSADPDPEEAAPELKDDAGDAAGEGLGVKGSGDDGAESGAIGVSKMFVVLGAEPDVELDPGLVAPMRQFAVGAASAAGAGTGASSATGAVGASSATETAIAAAVASAAASAVGSGVEGGGVTIASSVIIGDDVTIGAEGDWVADSEAGSVSARLAEAVDSSG
jgi:hypothetical protein